MDEERSAQANRCDKIDQCVSTRRKAPQVPSRARKAEQSNQMTSAAAAAKATEVSPRLSQAGQASDAMSGVENNKFEASKS